MKSVNLYLLCKVHNLNCEVFIIFTVYFYLFTFFMKISNSSSRGVLVGMVVVIGADKLFFNDDISYTVRNQCRRINWGEDRAFLVQLQYV